MYSREDLLCGQINTGNNPAFMKRSQAETEESSYLLVVGIGGTGIKAVKRVAKRISEEMRHHRHVSFLAIDRDNTELAGLEDLDVHVLHIIPDTLTFAHLPEQQQMLSLHTAEDNIRHKIHIITDPVFANDPQRKVNVMLISGAAGDMGETFFERTARLIRTEMDGRDIKIFSFLSLLDHSDHRMHITPSTAEVLRNRQRGILQKIAAQPELFGALTLFHENHTGTDFSAHTLEEFIFSSAAYTGGTLLPRAFYANLQSACAMRTGTPLPLHLPLLDVDPAFSEYHYAHLTCSDFRIPVNVLMARIIKEIAEDITAFENSRSFPVDSLSYDDALKALLPDAGGSLRKKTEGILIQCERQCIKLPEIDMHREEFFGGGWQRVQEECKRRIDETPYRAEPMIRAFVHRMFDDIRRAAPGVMIRYGLHAIEYLYRERPPQLDRDYETNEELRRLRDHLIDFSIHHQIGNTLQWLQGIAHKANEIVSPNPPEAVPIFIRAVRGAEIQAEWIDRAMQATRWKARGQLAECAFRVCRELYYSEMDKIYESCKTLSCAVDRMLDAYREIDSEVLSLTEFSIDQKWSEPCTVNACSDPTIRQWALAHASTVASSVPPEEFRRRLFYEFDIDSEFFNRTPGREVRKRFDDLLSGLYSLGKYDQTGGITFSKWFEETMDNTPIGQQNAILSGVAAQIVNCINLQENHLSFSTSPYRERVLLLPEALQHSQYALSLTTALNQALAPVLIGYQSASDSVLCYTLKEGIAIAELPDI